MSETAFAAIRKWFEAVILACCCLLMKTLYTLKCLKIRTPRIILTVLKLSSLFLNDQDQTAPDGAVRLGSMLFDQTYMFQYLEFLQNCYHSGRRP